MLGEPCDLTQKGCRILASQSLTPETRDLFFPASVSQVPPPSAAQNVNLKFQTLDLTGSSLPLHSGCGRLLPEGVLLSPPRCPFFGARLILGILLSFDSEQEQVLGTLLPLVTEPRWGLTGGRWCVSPRPLLGVAAAGASQEGRWDR